MKVVHLLGIAGVAEHERPAAKLWGKRLEWPMVGVAFWIVVQWYLEETQSISPILADVADWLVWLAFLLETSFLTALVADRRSFLISNWLNLVIIIGGLPIFWHVAPLAGLLRSFRLILVVMLLVRMSKSARRLLSQHRLGATMVVALVTMVLSGIVISRIDPSIGTVWDGMWWAWVTMATVGYGDVVPHNGAGRLFGALLILFGVVLLSMLTANLAAFFIGSDIGSDVEKVEREEKEADRLLKDISARLERIERLLEEKKGASPD
ncbi:ion transporter [Ferrigenium kumadai]|uniref:Ion transporter n=1 Tax=Ferrigenium kumadai TaxID=1682490 RepID=A0AAN1VYX2_9PROT|nr:potassium channel family protein [Ferrigenium kumadai]BBI98674.1 ion transporter [Ferrigenium kumadai]